MVEGIVQLAVPPVPPSVNVVPAGTVQPELTCSGTQLGAPSIKPVITCRSASVVQLARFGLHGHFKIELVQVAVAGVVVVLMAEMY